jgi:nucleoid-associated protein YgaU
MAAAALGIVVLILVLWFALRPASTPPTAPGTQTAATGQATQPGTVGQPGRAGQPGTAGQPGSAAQPGTAGQPGSAAQPGTAATGTATVTAPAKAPAAIRTVHEVREGQSLWRISRFYYELGSRWRRIFDENQEQIKEPDLIYPKQKFRIPQ